MARLLETFPERVAGLKDSSGDLPYARSVAGLKPGFAVFPSNEAALAEARSGMFAGCISATANLNADLCARGYQGCDEATLASAVAIRRIFDGHPLVPGVKAVLAHRHGDGDLARTMPPLASLASDVVRTLSAQYDALRRRPA